MQVLASLCYALVALGLALLLAFDAYQAFSKNNTYEAAGAVFLALIFLGFGAMILVKIPGWTGG